MNKIEMNELLAPTTSTGSEIIEVGFMVAVKTSHPPARPPVPADDDQDAEWTRNRAKYRAAAKASTMRLIGRPTL